MATVTLDLSEERWEQVKALAAKEGVSPQAWLESRMDLSVEAAARKRWLKPPGLPTMAEIMKDVTPDMLHGPREGLFDLDQFGEGARG